MDFFESQDTSRRKTKRLLVYFGLAVGAMIAVLYLAAILIFPAAVQQLEIHREGGSPGTIDWWQPPVFAVVAAAVTGVVLLGSAYKTAQLRSGGESVAAMLGGRRIRQDTTDLQKRRLLNIVEEMALASGVPVPPVYLLEKEESINAFAAGYGPGDAVIGVNRGTIQYLARDELQGVIAHEFSHILNGDMRLNIRLIGLLHGILVLALIGYYMLRLGGRGSSRSDRKGGGQVALLGLALLAIGYLGLFFARLIKAAVSRQREYLADASAVQFTRNPDGIAGALKKIGGLSLGSRMKTPEAESASHLFFGSYRPFSFLSLATHPPLIDRIRRIDRHFDGQFPVVQAVAERPPAAHRAEPAKSPFDPLRQVLPHGRAGRMAIDPAVLLTAVGTLSQDRVQYARELVDELPAAVRTAVHEPFSARTVVLALLLGDESPVRTRQLSAIRTKLGDATLSQTERIESLVRSQPVPFRLPMLELVQTSLQDLTAGQFREFAEAVRELIQADQRVDLFEFTVIQTLLKRLERHFGHAAPVRQLYPALSGLAEEIGVLLSALAHVGHRDEATAQSVFQQACATLGLERMPPWHPRDAWSLSQLREALDKLAQGTPPVKRRVIGAATAAIAADGTVNAGEAELLRAIGDTLECPIPPLYARVADRP